MQIDTKNLSPHHEPLNTKTAQPGPSLLKKPNLISKISAIALPTLVGLGVGLAVAGVIVSTGGAGLVAIPIFILAGGAIGLVVSATSTLVLPILLGPKAHFNKNVPVKMIETKNQISTERMEQRTLAPPDLSSSHKKSEKEMQKEKATKMGSEISLLIGASRWQLQDKDGLSEKEFLMAWTYNKELQATINPLYNQIRCLALHKAEGEEYPKIKDFKAFATRILNSIPEEEKKWPFQQAFLQIEKKINELDQLGQLDKSMEINDFLNANPLSIPAVPKVLYENYYPYRENQKVFTMAIRSQQEIIMEEVLTRVQGHNLSSMTDEDFEAKKEEITQAIQALATDSLHQVRALEQLINDHQKIENQLVTFVRQQIMECFYSIKYKGVEHGKTFICVEINLDAALKTFQERCMEQLSTYPIKGDDLEQLRDYYEEIIVQTSSYIARGVRSKIKNVNANTDLTQEDASGRHRGLQLNERDAFTERQLNSVFTSTIDNGICGLKGDAFINVMGATIYQPTQVMKQLEDFFRFLEAKRVAI